MSFKQIHNELQTINFMDKYEANKIYTMAKRAYSFRFELFILIKYLYKHRYHTHTNIYIYKIGGAFVIK